jgi:nitrous oxidase accessory protein NosD
MKAVGMIGLSAVVVGVLSSGASAGATPPVMLKCGQTVTTSVKLGNDLLNCPEDGLVVGASGITIDLNGHRITGPPQEGGDPALCFCGVNDKAGFDNITLRSGRIEGFRHGASFEDAEAVTVRNLVTRGERTNPTNGHGGNGVFLERAHGARVSGSTFTDAWRGVLAQDSSEVVIEKVQVAEIEHAGLALKRDTDSTVRHANIDTGGGEWSIEVVNSSRTVVTHNRIRHFSLGIGVAAFAAFGGLPAVGNKVENKVMRDGVTSGSTGISLFEIDGGTVRETTVAQNTIIAPTEEGIFAGAANSSDGLGNPPFEEVVGMGPDQSLIEGNLVNGKDASTDGILLHAPGNVLTGNRANRNAEWGIDAIEGTIDGGGNTAHKNGQPAQCRGVVCNGHPTDLAVDGAARPAVHRFSGVRGDRPLRRSR